MIVAAKITDLSPLRNAMFLARLIHGTKIDAEVLTIIRFVAA